MGSYYSSNPKFYVGIDCIIFGFNEGELNLLLLKKKLRTCNGQLVTDGRICSRKRKRRRCSQTGSCRTDRTGQRVYGTSRFFRSYRPRSGERVISIAYYALVNINEYDKALVQQHNAFG